MVTIIKKGSPKKRIIEILEKLQIPKGFDAFKFCGVIRLEEDALSIQKKLRNEWE